MGKQVPILGLFNLSNVTALSSPVKGYSGWLGGSHRFWAVTKDAE